MTLNYTEFHTSLDDNKLKIIPDNKKLGYNIPTNDSCICIIKNENECEEIIGVTLKEAKFIRDAFTEIINYLEKLPQIKIEQEVEVIKGIFKGYFGKIIGIDKCDIEKPVMVKLNDNPDFNNCICYVNYSDVKILLEEKR